ncbi:glycosyltransferase family 2 protein [Arenimonas sp.]|uniref:glycosyltransferase family 2 protein n=1 Tax=Arenimonas sp. TaxID=1872635 RepID=UPI0039C8B93F
MVIATFNASSTLQECLDSITGQDFPDIEILVADGGSTDGTADVIVRNAARIAWSCSGPDGGIYDAWNKAVAMARGEYVMFLGADDALESATTMSRVFALIGDREFDLVSGIGVLVDDAGVGYHRFGGAWNHRKVGRRMTICHPGALHRRDLFDRFGCFDTSYRICADYDFILRLPQDTRALFFDAPIARIRDAGVSRRRRMQALRERYRAQSSCPRIGPAFAALYYLDKLWRIPVARLLGIPN